VLHQIGEALHERLSSCATRSLLLIVAPALKHLVESLSEEEPSLSIPSKQSENNLEHGKGQKHVGCTEKMSDKECDRDEAFDLVQIRGLRHSVSLERSSLACFEKFTWQVFVDKRLLLDE
jgi:hypothetical protein